MRYYRDFPLKYFHSFRIDSTAKEIYFPESIEELEFLVNSLWYPPIFAGGYNVLFNSKINTLICLQRMPGSIHMIDNIMMVDANTSITTLVNTAKYGGFEQLWGIPGTVGGGVVMNAGSGQCTISDYIRYVSCINRIFDKEDMHFGRRQSVLQDEYHVITYVSFVLDKQKPIDKSVLKQTKKFRRNFPSGYSAGGVFKNWHVLKKYEEEIRRIEVPNVYVSTHLNVIMNKGKASPQNILDMINRIRDIVKEPLELEIKLIGF